MSAETSTWLNTNTLIGFTAKRGNAWHYRADDQGEESNHYVGAIPVEDVTRRLFDTVTVVSGSVESTVITADGVTRFTDPSSQSLWRLETGHRFGTFKLGYKIHDYQEWLLKNVATLLDDDLAIGSAGLLRGGGLAWVQVEVPETIDTPEGVSFRPFLSAATSLDGSLSSTYQCGAQVIVCDNTLSAALGERDATRVKIKHSRNSIGRIGEVRDALQLVHNVADAFTAQVAVLCATEVTDKAWSAFLEAHNETSSTDKQGELRTGRSATMADTRRQQLTQLWTSDLRVSPWQHTAFGVVQAVNTFAHHLGTTRGASKAERNAERAVLGAADALDQSTLDTLQRVLASV